MSSSRLQNLWKYQFGEVMTNPFRNCLWLLELRSELNLDLKNIKTEQAKFLKQHRSVVKMELLIQAHLTRQSASLSSSLQSDFRRMLELAPRLLEELVKIAVLPRTSQGHG